MPEETSAEPPSPRVRPRPEAGFTKSHLVRPVPRASASASTALSLERSVAPPAQLFSQGRETICHGLLRDPRPGGAVITASVAMPDPLVFFSWWNEEVATPVECTPSGQGMGVRRQVRLHYLPRAQAFQLFAEDTDAALSLAIEHADGTSVQATELHVGAKLDVLGRPMTLRSASARTISWIDAEAKRLLKRREALCAQISKFKDVHKALASVNISQLYLNAQMAPTTQTPVPTGGKANLHRLHSEIEALEGLLLRYRS